jgi:hypothetical protein
MMVGPPRPALALPIEPAARHPRAPEAVDVVLPSWELRPAAVRRVQRLVDGVRIAGVVIAQRHEHVAGVAGDHDVLDLRPVRQPVERQMALHEAPVFLPFETVHHQPDASEQPAVDPRRVAVERPVELRALKHQQAHDPLHPGRAGFVGRRDDDVVGSGLVAIPP